MYFLEIQYQIFKDFTPQQIFMTKDSDHEYLIEYNITIIDEKALDLNDRKLIKILKAYLIDLLDNCYNALIKEIFNQVLQGHQGDGVVQKDQMFDKYHFFKLSSFMI